MHPLALVLLCVLSAVVLFGNRIAAAAGLIAGACLMTMGQIVVIGPFHFHFFRLIILAGFVRMTIRGELFDLRLNNIDLAILAWSAILLVTCIGHTDPSVALVFGLGVTFSTTLAYFLFRALVRSVEDIVAISKWLTGILVVLAVAMVVEKATGHTAWEMFGAVGTSTRNEKVRAVGPFRHAILAGSVGAALVPLMVALWFRSRNVAIGGIVSGLAMTVACASSGPYLALAAGMFALYIWRYRENRRLIVWTGVAGLLLLQIVMKDNVWYLIARVDLVGGSTGWHRAYLIDQALAHLGEWWLAGTDYTRHWMPTGVSWSPNHTDITNHYIGLGVTGGVGLVISHVWTLTLAFKSAGSVLDRYADAPWNQRFIVWSLGCVLFGHTVNSLGIYYFDQSVVLVYFVLACISSLEAYPASLSSQATAAATPKKRRLRLPRILGTASVRSQKPSGRPSRPRWQRVRLPGTRRADRTTSPGQAEERPTK